MTFDEAIDFIDKESFIDEYMFEVVTIDKMKELINIIYSE